LVTTPFIDTAVLMNAAGAEHPLPEPCRRVMLAIGFGALPAVTSTDGANMEEVVQDARDRVLTVGVQWLERLSDVAVARQHFAELPSTNHAPGIVTEGSGGRFGLTRSSTCRRCPRRAPR